MKFRFTTRALVLGGVVLSLCHCDSAWFYDAESHERRIYQKEADLAGLVRERDSMVASEGMEQQRYRTASEANNALMAESQRLRENQSGTEMEIRRTRDEINDDEDRLRSLQQHIEDF